MTVGLTRAFSAYIIIINGSEANTLSYELQTANCKLKNYAESRLRLTTTIYNLSFIIYNLKIPQAFFKRNGK